MKLWIAISVLGKIAAVVGPLPYDEHECQRRVIEASAGLDGDATFPIMIDGIEVPVTGRDIKSACVYSETPPKIQFAGPIKRVE